MSASANPYWVEIVSRHGDVIVRQRVDGGEVRIGRGYENDIVIDDPYVGARHVRIARDANGAFIAEDLGSVNGLFRGASTTRESRLALGADEPIRIGTTYLRIREASYVVAPERALQAQAWGWPIALALACAMIGLQLLATWLRQTTEPRLADYASPALVIALVTAAWTGAWAIASRIFAGRARFRRNFVIAVLGLVALLLVQEVSEDASFALSRREFTAYRYIVLWLVVAAIAFAHLRLMSLSHMRLKGIAVGVIALTAIGMQTLSNARTHSESDRQNYVRTLKPPLFRLTSLRRESSFFSDAAKLKNTLDRARSQEESSLGDYAEDEDD